eukprot:169044_1
MKGTRVYCICRQPHDKNGGMIQCGGCSEWFHFRCLNIDEGSLFYHDDKSFPCPFCNQYQQKIHNDVQQSENIEQLIPILRTIDLNKIKMFIIEQSKNERVQESRSRCSKYNSMNATLPDDVLQSILQFDSNRTQNRRVSRKWNEISNKIENIAFRKTKKEIEKRQPKDTKETYLMKQMSLVKRTMRKALNRLDKECEMHKKRIEDKYTKLVNELGQLSRYQCNTCGMSGYCNVVMVKCKTCKLEMCSCTALSCENQCNTENEYYCSKYCDARKKCEGCFRALCDYCAKESEECWRCSTKVCESCAHYRDEERDTGPTPWDFVVETQTWCGMCYDNR